MSPHDLTALDVAGRVPRLRERMAADGHDLLLVTRLVNVRYLTGFTGSAGRLLVAPDALVFLTDGRYRDQSTAQLRDVGVEAQVVVGTAEEQRSEIQAAVAGAERLALEDHDVSWAEQRRLAEALAPVELVPAGTPVEDLRRVKDAGEVARVRAACAIGDEALAEVAPTLVSGPTEVEVALALELAMRRRGASGLSFEPIVASGPNAARPHARPSERPVGRHELVVLDFGCVVDGYCSDMTRTLCVGEPSAEARRMYEVVLDAQAAGRAAVRADVECAAIDAACRDRIEAAGLGEAFLHSTGHGVGLEIHEDPRVAARAGGTVRDGDVVTVEPGVYLTGAGGVRIEDTVVVTGAGADVLTASPKDLVL